MTSWLDTHWRQVRAVLVALHVIAVLVLSFPASPKLADPARWQDQRTRREIALWAERMQSAGIDTTPERLEGRLWSLVHGYLAVRQALGKPFEPYAETACAYQTWGMFRSPQRRPGELVVSLRERGRWHRVHVSRSEEHTYLARELDHNRLRKQVARAITDPVLFEQLAEWIARRAARDHPNATDAVVEILRFESPPPDRNGSPRRERQWRKRFSLRAYR